MVFVVSVAGISAALAHEGKPYSPHNLWTMWSWDPGVIISLMLAAWLYVRGVCSLWQASAAGHGIRQWEAMTFGVGWLALWMALISPLHELGSMLFSAHMAQHEILMVAAAPLLVLGRPLMAFLWGLPLSWRRGMGRLSKREWVQSSWHMLTTPLLAWSLHAIVLWTWHAPRLFQAALESDLIHALQHLSFLVVALVFWWALIHGRQGQMGYGAAVLYVFTTSMHSGALGALLTFAPAPWYQAYAETTALWGLTPVEDQQLAGLIMWVPTGMLYLCAGLALFAGWLRALDARTHQRQGPALLQR